MKTITYDKELDCRGLNCPLPIVKTNQSIKSMEPGQILKVEASDPGSVNDMLAWSKRTQNELLTHQLEDEVYTYYIKKC